MNNKEQESEKLQWHPAFYAGLQIELQEDSDNLIFENEQEQASFLDYVKENWNPDSSYEDDPRLPYFPEIQGYNMDVFKRNYIHSLILNDMLEMFRRKAWCTEWGVN